MGWLSDIFKGKQENIQERAMNSYPGGNFAYHLLSESTQINKETEIMSIATASRCMTVVSETVATLSGYVYTNDRYVENHPLHKLWFKTPNNLYNAFLLKRQLVLNYQNLGNGFAVITRNDRGTPQRIDLVRSMRVIIHEGEKYYFDGTSDNIYEADDVIHLANIGTSPYIGVSKIFQHAYLFGKSKAALEYVNKMYSNNMFLGGVIQYPENIKMTSEKAKELSESAKINYGGINKAGGLFVLDQGGILKQFENSMPLSDAEYVQSERLTNEDMCRVYGVPTFMVFDYNNMSGDAMEAAKITYVENTILPIMTQLEQELENKLFKYERKTKIKHEIKSLLRADIKSQAEYWSKMAAIGKYTINELRAMDDDTPVEGGDIPLIQANNYFPLNKLEEYADAMIKEKLSRANKLDAEAEATESQSEQPEQNQTNETTEDKEE